MQDKITKSIKLIQDLQKSDQEYVVAFSAGKDSIVVLDLVKRSGVPFTAEYSNTTIDPPGTMKFIREHYPEVKILQPEKSFYELIKHKGLPTRIGRFCCEALKERAGIGKRVIGGARWDENQSRAKYTPEDCDTRKWMKGAVHIRPILNWTEREVWKYIRDNKLPYLKYYDPPYNFKRHGCVGCPYAGPKGMIKEFKLFPKHARAVIKAIRIHMEFKPNNRFARDFNDEYEVFAWWVSGVSINQFLQMRDSNLFGIEDYKKQIEKIIFNPTLPSSEPSPPHPHQSHSGQN